jgi:hypothetical protein
MTTISSTFESFREHLDEHYERRDRLIKVFMGSFFLCVVVVHACLFFLDLGQPRYIGGLKEGHFPPSTDIERHVKRRPCTFSPRRNRSEKEVGRNS